MEELVHFRDLIVSMPAYLTIKWLVLAGISILIIALITLEQRKMSRYYQRLTSHASVEDASAAEYSLKLLTISTRNKFLFSTSFLILTFSVIFYDVRQQRMLEQHDADAARQLAAECESKSDKSAATAPAGDEDATALDEAKRKYEKQLVNFYLLRKCNMAGADEFAIVQAAMLAETKQLGADASFASQTQATAKSAFNELYKDFNCSSKKLDEISKQFQSDKLSDKEIIYNNI